MAHRIPYVATASVSNLRDLERKVDLRDGDSRRALYPYPRAVPARLGLGVGRHDQESRGWRSRPASSRCSRRRTAKSRRVRRSGTRFPVTEYLKLQKRYRPSFRQSAGPRTHCADSGDGRPQHRRVRLAALGDCRWTSRSRLPSMSARASPTRPARGAPTGPLYVDRLPPCNHACPAGENIQGWLYHAESGDYEAAWRALTEDNPLPRDHGARLLSPLRRPRATAARSTRRWASTRSSAFSATKR